MALTVFDDVRLFVTDEGAGEPVLLVHGWGSDAGEWDQHVAALAERHRVIAPDLRGHGRSSVPAAGNEPRAMAADLAALLHRLGTGPVVAIGHSMGAQVVSVLAVEHPSLVSALVTLDPGYGVVEAAAPYLAQVVEGLSGDDPTGTALAVEEWSFTPATAPAVRAAHRRRIAGTAPHVLAQAFAGIFTAPGAFGLRPASEAYLARRARPVLSIWADAGRAAWEERLLTNPGSRVLAWPGAGHYLHEERPAEFLATVTGWLDSLMTEVLDGPT